jgi:hypothetical protein
MKFYLHYILLRLTALLIDQNFAVNTVVDARIILAQISIVQLVSINEKDI